LTGLPATLARLENLTKLVLSNNNLDSLPSDLARLKNLKHLNLYGNGQLDADAIYRVVSEFPQDIMLATDPEGGNSTENKLLVNINPSNLDFSRCAALEHLTELWLYDDQLAELPPVIGQMKRLDKLVMGKNLLETLPATIGDLTLLTELHLGENRLASLPPEIGRLENLTHLGLSKNRLKKLPDALAQLENLTVLDLRGNEFTQLPAVILQMKNLQNWISHIPELPACPPGSDNSKN
jgi:Leucine-rich repeat (LRR) protein